MKFRPRSILLLSLLAVLLSVSVGGARADLPPPPGGHGILNGNLVKAGEYPEVFYVTFENSRASETTQSICSGVLVHPRLILLAAHCFNTGGSIKSIGNGTQSYRRKYRGQTAKLSFRRAHPKYRQQKADTPAEMAANAKWDLAFLVLKHDLSDIAIPEVLLQPDVEAATALTGSRVKLVGYGFHKYRKTFIWNSSIGIKRSGDNVIHSILPDMLLMGEREGGALPGDSGGPVFLEGPEGRSVLGIIHSMIRTSRGGYGGTTAHRFSQASLCWVKKESRIDFMPTLDCSTEGNSP